jgi:hypothetical protein
MTRADFHAARSTKQNPGMFCPGALKAFRFLGQPSNPNTPRPVVQRTYSNNNATQRAAPRPCVRSERCGLGDLAALAVPFEEPFIAVGHRYHRLC